ncbi:MAG: MFS transporter, partial [Solirubrobacteraceae bacterium]
LGGILLTGIGVGLTLPTLVATGSASLPASSFATGSAVVNMFRQIGLAIGVAVLIAVLGSPHSPAAVLAAYQRAWVVTAGIALAGAVVGLALLTTRRRRVDVGASTASAATTRTPA